MLAHFPRAGRRQHGQPEFPDEIFADIGAPEGQELVRRQLLDPAVRFAYLRPPWGSASRLRGSRCSAARSAEFPAGLPAVESTQPHVYERLCSENSAFRFCLQLAREAVAVSVEWVLELPSTSFFWGFREVSDFPRDAVHISELDVCAYGGRRDRRLRLWSSWPPASLPRLRCDGLHSHTPWAAMSDEQRLSEAIEIPAVLAQVIARAAAGACGLPPGASGLPPSRRLPDGVARDRQGVGIQARGSRGSPILPEYREVVDVVLPARLRGVVCEAVGTDLPDAVGLELGFDERVRVLSVSDEGTQGLELPTRGHVSELDADVDTDSDEAPIYIGRWHRRPSGRVLPASEWANPFKVRDFRERDECLSRFEAHLKSLPDLSLRLRRLSGRRIVCHCGADESCHGDRIITAFAARFGATAGSVVSVGLKWSVEEFSRAACRVPHPFAGIVADDVQLRNIFGLLSEGVEGFMARAEAVLDKVQARIQEVAHEEDALHAACDEQVERVIKAKRIIVFAELLRESGFPNVDGLVDCLRRGFSLVGVVPPSGCFGRTPPVQPLPLAELSRRAPSAQARCASMTTPELLPEDAEDLHKATRKEVEQGWLVGPLTRDMLTAKYGPDWVPARRFGVKQKTKVRPVDDYSLFGQNAATAVSEKVDAGGVDAVAQIVRGLMHAFTVPGRVEVSLSDGSVLSAPLHADFAAVENRALVGKVWDLSSAYRQLARRPEHAKYAIVCAWDLEVGKALFYEQPVLPFGSVASVHGFCWTARALWHCLTSMLGVTCTHYVDDFPVIAFAAAAPRVQRIVDRFFDLLGWETKAQLPFSRTFQALGVEFELSRSAFGEVVVRNTEARLAELKNAVQDLVRRDGLTPSEARVLRGRLQFARAQAFGRVGGHCFLALSRVADRAQPSRDDVRSALRAANQLVRSLSSGPPRALPALFPAPSVLFTDGACEDIESGRPTVSVGGVLFQDCADDARFFSLRLGAALVEYWRESGREQLVGQAELLPVALAKCLWGDLLRGRPLVSFVDNEAAKFALISGSSPVRHSAEIVAWSSALDCTLGVAQWVARVPTCANPADGPSRFSVADLRWCRSVLRTDIPLELIGAECEGLVSRLKSWG